MPLVSTKTEQDIQQILIKRRMSAAKKSIL